MQSTTQPNHKRSVKFAKAPAKTNNKKKLLNFLIKNNKLIIAKIQLNQKKRGFKEKLRAKLGLQK